MLIEAVGRSYANYKKFLKNLIYCLIGCPVNF